MSEVKVKCLMQSGPFVFVYALPFEPVVWSRSILGLGLPSSANGIVNDHYQSIGIVCQ